jgi:hypothetical protein
MTPFEFSAIVCATTYKPGSKIKFYKETECMYWLRAILPVRDIYPPHGTIDVEMGRRLHIVDIERITDPMIPLSMVYNLWRSIEMHEIEEYFMYHGQHFINPHQTPGQSRRSRK